MATFTVRITETVRYVVEVEAPDEETAEARAEAKFLSASDIGIFPCDVIDRSAEVANDCSALLLSPSKRRCRGGSVGAPL